MSTVKKLTKVVNGNSKKFQKRKSYTRPMEYYEDLKKRGIIKKEEYDIPSINTLGAVHE